MNLSDISESKYTILFVLFLVIVVSIWVSRTYRDGRFSLWIAPSGSYGTGIIEGMSDATSKKCDRTDKTYCIFKDYKIGESITTIPANTSNMTNYRGKSGYFSVSITGNTSGTVWGTDIYTDDSSIGRAAMHAGLVKNGETKTLIIQMLPARSSYSGTTRNSVNTNAYGNWGGSYQFVSLSGTCNAPTSSQDSYGGLFNYNDTQLVNWLDALYDRNSGSDPARKERVNVVEYVNRCKGVSGYSYLTNTKAHKEEQTAIASAAASAKSKALAEAAAAAAAAAAADVKAKAEKKAKADAQTLAVSLAVAKVKAAADAVAAAKLKAQTEEKTKLDTAAAANAASKAIAAEAAAAKARDLALAKSKALVDREKAAAAAKSISDKAAAAAKVKEAQEAKTKAYTKAAALVKSSAETKATSELKAKAVISSNAASTAAAVASAAADSKASVDSKASAQAQATAQEKTKSEAASTLLAKRANESKIAANNKLSAETTAAQATKEAAIAKATAAQKAASGVKSAADAKAKAADLAAAQSAAANAKTSSEKAAAQAKVVQAEKAKAAADAKELADAKAAAIAKASSDAKEVSEAISRARSKGASEVKISVDAKLAVDAKNNAINDIMPANVFNSSNISATASKCDRTDKSYCILPDYTTNGSGTCNAPTYAQESYSDIYSFDNNQFIGWLDKLYDRNAGTDPNKTERNNVLSYVNRCKSISGYEYLNITKAGIASGAASTLSSATSAGGIATSAGGIATTASVQDNQKSQPKTQQNQIVIPTANKPKKAYYTINNFKLSGTTAAAAAASIKSTIPGNTPVVAAYEPAISM